MAGCCSSGCCSGPTPDKGSNITNVKFEKEQDTEENPKDTRQIDAFSNANDDVGGLESVGEIVNSCCDQTEGQLACDTPTKTDDSKITPKREEEKGCCGSGTSSACKTQESSKSGISKAVVHIDEPSQPIATTATVSGNKSGCCSGPKTTKNCCGQNIVIPRSNSAGQMSTTASCQGSRSEEPAAGDQDATKNGCCAQDETATLLPGCQKSCCGSSKAPKDASTRAGCCPEKKPSHSVRESNEQNSPTSCREAPQQPKRAGGGCCSDSKTPCRDDKPQEPTAPSRPPSCADSCCDSAESPPEISAVELSPSSSDLEKGPGQWERAILAVQGMTCTGCETKLQRTLATLRGLSDVKSSLVLSRAEFRLDVGVTTIDEVITHLKRTTGFDCRQIEEGGHRVEVNLKGNEDLLGREKLPEGVVGVSVVDDETLAISYDANIIGARDVVGGCFGRELELAPMRIDPSIAAGAKHVRHVGFMTLLSALLTIPVLVLAWAPLPQSRTRGIIYGSVSLALATVIQVFVAGPFYPAALKALIFARVVEMDLLIVLSTSAAYIFSVVAFGFDVAGSPLRTGEFFETSTLLVTLIMLGRFVSALARQKAVESISIRSLQVTTAVLVEGGGRTREIDARLLHYGDMFKVRPESRVPTDGIVADGVSEVDESMITGESLPIEKNAGDSLVAGSVNGTGTLTARTTSLPGANTISAIANMVDEAKLSKPRIQDLADRVAGYFVPVVAVLASLTFVIWIGVGIGVRHQSATDAVVEATTYAIAVLIVSCPCAIGLAVPMVVVIAGGVAADRGVIFRTAETIETARRVTHVVFDKTGTLTQGKLSVVLEEISGGEEAWVKAVILGLLAGIKHPVSIAVTSYLRDRGLEEIRPASVKSLPAKGVEGVVGGLQVKAGNVRWLGLEDHPAVQGMAITVFCVTIDGRLRAVYGLEDSIRPEALSVISTLQTRNINISLLSGDDPAPVSAVALRLGIPSAHVRSRCTPASKAEYIRALLPFQSPSKRYASSSSPTVIFIGDGTNDAPALAAASIGIHMGDGTSDLARSAADAVLVRPDLRGILVLLEVSAAAFRRITFNFGWAFVYNLFAVLLAGGAFVKARIPPAYAGLGEIVSVLPVVGVAVGMRWKKFGDHEH